jgi:hypothetical protein
MSGIGGLLALGVLLAGAVVYGRAGWRLWSNPKHFESGEPPFFISPRHLLSDRGWTPEGLAARRAWFRAGLRTTLLVIGAWLVLDVLF